MPVLKVYPNGVTMGRAPKKNDHERGKRGEVTGWSASAARRNLAFLRSVLPDDLTGYGYTVTFTLKNCPESAEHWKRLREALFKRFERMGMIRGHWVTEWQKRGVPHLHGIFYFDSPGLHSSLVSAWLEIAAEFVVSRKAQHVREVTDVVGWFKYLAKHAARGHQHYQRAKEAIPEGWKKTGRVWGYVGTWPLGEVQKYHVDDAAFFRLRRISRGLEVAHMREKVTVHVEGANGGLIPTAWKYPRDVKGIARARRRLKHSDRELSRLKGISDWLPRDLIDRLILHLAASGAVLKLEGSNVLVTPDGMRFDAETGEILP